MFCLAEETLVCKQYVTVGFKEVTASFFFFFFWQRRWSVLGNAKEFVIYKHVPDILAIRNFSEMKCQECAWEQQMPFIRRPIAGLLMRCLSPSGVPSAALTLQLQGHSPTFSHYLGSTYQPWGVRYMRPLPRINAQEADLVLEVLEAPQTLLLWYLINSVSNLLVDTLSSKDMFPFLSWKPRIWELHWIAITMFPFCQYKEIWLWRSV